MIARSDIPCPKCKSTQSRLCPGKGPHVAQLRCNRCDAFIKWVPRRQLDDMGVDPEQLTDTASLPLFG
ncbi:MAG: hypothetical protein ACRCU2_31425, partial [Planktothrix sp.]